jgi:hypothetical protein
MCYSTSTEEELDITFRLMLFRRSTLELGLEEGQSTVFCLGSLKRVNFSPIEACLNQGREIFLLVLPLLGGFAWLPMELSWAVAIDMVITCCFRCFNSSATSLPHSHQNITDLKFRQNPRNLHIPIESAFQNLIHSLVFLIELKLEKYQKFSTTNQM